MTPQALIFDIDGTLWDSRSLVAQGYNMQLRDEGLAHLCVTAEDLKPLFGKVMTEIGDILFASIPQPERYALMRRCMARENQYLRASACDVGYPGVRETMERLHETYRLFLVSNSQCGYPELCMEKLGLDSLMEGHLCFGDTGTSKGQTISRLMTQYRISSAVYIGDTQGDRDAAKEAGIPFVWAAYGFGTPDGYFAKIDCFSQLLTVF